jgi:hypothetical protein
MTVLLAPERIPNMNCTEYIFEKNVERKHTHCNQELT